MPHSVSFDLAPRERLALLDVARQAIAATARRGATPQAQGELSPALLEARASFVTLEQRGQLRGCIGSLEPRRALVEDVTHNAVAAASQDPRFPPLAVVELDVTEIEISILGPLRPVEFRDEGDLLAQLQPGVDGLVLREGARRGTFLPLVWEKLPDRHSFLRQLKLKAGLPPDYWSATLQVWRYHTLVFREGEA